MSVLFCIGTPIGNLKDLSTRAIEVLRTVKTIFAEDTRITKKLIARANMTEKPILISFNAHTKPADLRALVSHLDRGDCALLSDAGTPGVSDPGAALVSAALAAGHSISPVPGPSALATILSVAGFEVTRTLFLGFLPRNGATRRAHLREIIHEEGAIVFFEAPHRLQATLTELSALIPDRMLCVGREMTKLHEELFWGTIKEAQAHFTNPRGEFTVILKGVSHNPISTADLQGAARILSQNGFAGRGLVEELVKRTGSSRSKAYSIALEIKAK